jgi:D-amino-acid dehydrogenase
VRDLGPRLPVEAGKGYALDLERTPSTPGSPLILHESRVAVTPFEDRLRLAGTLQLSGLDMSVDKRRVEAIWAAAQRQIAPDALGERREVWRGLRPCAPDGLPIVGRHAKRPDVIVATGHAQLGLTLAPVTGRLVTELLSGDAERPELAVLSPARF